MKGTLAAGIGLPLLLAVIGAALIVAAGLPLDKPGASLPGIPEGSEVAVATPSPTPSEPAQARTPTPSRADTIRAPAAPLPPAESTGPGAMGGRGAPGKKPPATTP